MISLYKQAKNLLRKGFSCEQIAATLQVSKATVEKIKQRMIENKELPSE